MVKLKDETYLEETNYLQRIELKRRSEELVGHVVMQSKNNAYLLALWSHGKLYSHSLIGSSMESGSHSLVSVLTNINTNYPVVMTSLSETTIAIYGADVSEEGAVLIIYNVQFKLVQAVQKLKLYTKDAKLWRIEDKLLLAANRHLAIAPFHLAPQKIAALLGSSTCKKDNNKESNEDDVIIIQESTIAQWDEGQSAEKRLALNRIPANISKQISTYINEGLSDAAIQTTLIPQLIESSDISAIIWCLEVFKDLPERLLTDLLIFTLRSPEEIFVPFQNGMDNEDSPLTVDSLHRRNFFLDKILSLSYSDICLVSYLKHSISFDEILRLLNYLIQRLSDSGNVYDNIEQPSEKQLFEWSCLLLDSHYQHYILSQDTEVLVLLNKLNAILEDHLQLLRDMENLRPVLIRTISGKPLKLSSNSYNKFYNIEEISLY
ncbi:hypothetical protein KM043_011474 [Ampulex compressa]|nr:hypothetical protein KM043_011474 [Ampulex compressa]